jgi:hypothetical protein
VNEGGRKSQGGTDRRGHVQWLMEGWLVGWGRGEGCVASGCGVEERNGERRAESGERRAGRHLEDLGNAHTSAAVEPIVDTVRDRPDCGEVEWRQRFSSVRVNRV